MMMQVVLNRFAFLLQARILTWIIDFGFAAFSELQWEPNVHRNHYLMFWIFVPIAPSSNNVCISKSISNESNNWTVLNFTIIKKTLVANRLGEIQNKTVFYYELEEKFHIPVSSQN